MATLKHRLNKTDDRVALHVVTIPSPVVSQAMAAAGADVETSSPLLGHHDLADLVDLDARRRSAQPQVQGPAC